jgi:L-threonine-O-3-phosphate decarboxylase
LTQDTFRAQPAHGGNLTWAASLAGCSPSAILDFSASINPLGPPQSAIAAIQNHLSDLPHYPDPDYRLLRRSLGQAHGLPPDWILPGNGSAELLTWASRELAELDTTYLITPAFGDYLRALSAFDAQVVGLPLKWKGGMWSVVDGEDETEKVGEGLIRPDFCVTAANNAPLRSGLLLNNPHNPTGQIFFREALLPLLEQFTLVVVDEAFMDFLLPHQQQSLEDMVQNYSNLVVLRSLTKFYSLPGLRLGYAIAHPDRLRRWQQWRDPWSVNVLAVAAAVAVLQDLPFQQQTWNWLETARSQLYHGLAALPGLHPFPGAANYLLVQSEQSAVQVQQRLLKHSQILVRDCVSFAELGDRYFRVAIRTEAENQRLLKGLAEIL